MWNADSEWKANKNSLQRNIEELLYLFFSCWFSVYIFEWLTNISPNATTRTWNVNFNLRSRSVLAKLILKVCILFESHIGAGVCLQPPVEYYENECAGVIEK